MTTTSALMGSPLYMSPEQMQSSRNVDARSDICALGVIRGGDWHNSATGAWQRNSDVAIDRFYIQASVARGSRDRQHSQLIASSLVSTVLGKAEKITTRRDG